MKEIKVGMFGLGTVGRGTAKILLGNKILLEDRCGFSINLTKICVKNLQKDRNIELGSCQLTTSADEILDDPEISLIVELIGGTDEARSIITKAIENGKQVVSANKALLAEFGDEIFELAESQGVDIGFDASVCGGIPIIHSIKEGFVSNHIRSIYGIINGTSNYILSKMTEEKREFKSVLKEAQELGYAEADPTYDIEGNDAAQKLAIMSSLAFGRFVSPSEVFTSGITEITPADIEYAEEFGYKIKLLAILKHVGHEIEVRVHPTMIPCKHMLSGVDDVYNAVFLKGDCVGTSMLYGEGAGEMPTASAVVSDIVNICRDIAGGVVKRVPCMNYVSKVHKDVINIKNISDISCEYYMRFVAVDHPGVLAGILRIMSKYNISVASLVQKRSEEGNEAGIVVMTHTSREKDIQHALEDIEGLPDVLKKTVLIRVENI